MERLPFIRKESHRPLSPLGKGGTAAAMKKLAKDKMLRALSDQRYASTVYEQEMTQQALLEAVKKK